jgi:hypothetical protein
MGPEIALPFSRSAFERLDVPWLPNRGSKILRDDPIFLPLPDSGHQQDAGRDPGSAQRQTFRGIGHSQPLGALGFERQRALHRTMAVTVGFDHCADGNVCADMLLDRVKIFSQRGQRNFRPSPAVEDQRAAVGQFRQLGARSIHVSRL